MHEMRGGIMADNKRRYFERDSREKEAANSHHHYQQQHHGGGGGGGGSDRQSSGQLSVHSAHSAHSGGGQGGQSSKEPNYDEPPNSRLFILCGRNVAEEELREAFEKFGTIKELWIVKDKLSGESKGVAYIKYAKTSEAAVAMEEMNGKFIGNNAKSLKVLIASSRDQGSKREVNEEERLLRLFIIVPKSKSEADLRDHFAQFGDVEHCNIVRDRNTKESKGYAYVKFYRISHAAKAYEGCDRTFKPVFADPRPQKQFSTDDRYSSAHGSTTGPYDLQEYGVEHPYQTMINHGHQHSIQQHQQESASRLTIIAHGSLNQDQLWRLCDFFPGLDYCNVRHDQKTRQCFATVVYNSPQSAAYAKEKLHGFEYPPGHRLIVKFESAQEANMRSGSGILGPPSSSGRYNLGGNSMNGSNSSSALGAPLRSGNSIPPDLASLAETIAQATSIIQAAGYNAQSHHPHSQTGESYDPSYCSIKLPPPQPLAPIDSPVLERLFVVCHPSPPPLYALKDIFGRFGNLIDIFMLNGKNFGYAKYASKVSADDSRSTLHGQEICGMRLKVFPAEPQEQKGGASSSPSPSSAGGISAAGPSDQKCKRPKMECDEQGVL